MKPKLYVWLGVFALVAGSGAAVTCRSGGTGDAAGSHGLPPVVIVVFDEMSTDTLLGPDGRIDDARFPNFAALARTSTWFRNAQTVYDSTFKAVPAILDGRMPKRGTAPDVRSHQPSLYHLVDRLGYDVVKVESATAVCPPRICVGTRTRRPGVLERLAGGGRPARLHKWIGALRDRARPTFYLQHSLLPHEPWLYLPSGRQSRPSGEDPIRGINRPIGFDDPQLTDHNQLRHLLQVGYVDRQLGLIVRRMRRTGIFDRSVFIVVGDHGIAFEVGVDERRQVSQTNFEEIAAVPFFVKLPGQAEGRIDDSVVRNIDVGATLADVLGTRIWWKQDGASVFSGAARARRRVAMPRRDFSRVIAYDRAEFERRRHELRLARARKFGTGAQSELMFGDPWASAYRIGTGAGLLGRRLGAGRVTTSSRVFARLANAGLFADVQRSRQILPTRVAGRLEGSPPTVTRPIAAVVNGRIQAVGRSFRLRGRRPEYFSLLVPEPALRTGRNSVELMEIRGSTLVRLPAVSDP